MLLVHPSVNNILHRSNDLIQGDYLLAGAQQEDALSQHGEVV